jgi:DDE superfamily endonuclease
MAGAAHRGAAAHEEALEISRHAATRDDHGQAPFLRRGKGEDGPHRRHRQHKGLNNRAENSHQPTRLRERIMKRFKSARQAQRFLSVHDQVATSSTFPIQRRRPQRIVALPAIAPSRFGGTSPGPSPRLEKASLAGGPASLALLTRQLDDAERGGVGSFSFTAGPDAGPRSIDRLPLPCCNAPSTP